jgi:hypothetical protein
MSDDFAGWAHTGTTAEGVDVRVEGHPYQPRVWLDGVEVALAGRPRLLRDGGTRQIPTERGMLTLPRRLGDPDRTPRLSSSAALDQERRDD